MEQTSPKKSPSPNLNTCRRNKETHKLQDSLTNQDIENDDDLVTVSIRTREGVETSCFNVDSLYRIWVETDYNDLPHPFTRQSLLGNQRVMKKIREYAEKTERIFALNIPGEEMSDDIIFAYYKVVGDLIVYTLTAITNITGKNLVSALANDLVLSNSKEQEQGISLYDFNMESEVPEGDTISIVPFGNSTKKLAAYSKFRDYLEQWREDYWSTKGKLYDIVESEIMRQSALSRRGYRSPSLSPGPPVRNLSGPVRRRLVFSDSSSSDDMEDYPDYHRRSPSPRSTRSNTLSFDIYVEDVLKSTILMPNSSTYFHVLIASYGILLLLDPVDIHLNILCYIPLFGDDIGGPTEIYHTPRVWTAEISRTTDRIMFRKPRSMTEELKWLNKTPILRNPGNTIYSDIVSRLLQYFELENSSNKRALKAAIKNYIETTLQHSRYPGDELEEIEDFKDMVENL